MKHLALLFLLLFAKAALSQDTTYYDDNNQKVNTLSLASSYQIMVRNADDPSKVKKKRYYKSGAIKSEEEQYHPDEKRNGKIRHWYESGQLKSEVHYKNGLLHGEVLTYWENGVMKREDFFEEGKWVDGTCYNSNGDEIPHFDYEIQPEFPGGVSKLLRFLSDNVKYPVESRRVGAQGKVVVQFVIEEDGALSGLAIKKGVDKHINAEALRVVSKMPHWKPGMHDGEPVKVWFTLPISFSIH